MFGVGRRKLNQILHTTAAVATVVIFWFVLFCFCFHFRWQFYHWRFDIWLLFFLELSRWLILRLFRPSATQSERISQVFPSNTSLCHSHINQSINHHCLINTILSSPNYRKLNIVLLMISAKLRLALARSRHVSDFSRRTNALAARFEFQTMKTAIIVMLRVMTRKCSRFKTSLCALASTINWTLLYQALATMLAGFPYLQTLSSDHLYFDDQTYVVLQAFTM